jgi:hypothetical protein
MKQVEIELTDTDTYDDSYYFSFCSSRNKQISSQHSCRECVIQVLVEHHCESVYGKMKNFDPRWTRILVSKMNFDLDRDIVRKDMLRSLKILHHFEDLAGWTKSNVYVVGDYSEFYLFRGDPKWQRSPYTLSLYLLLIRLGRFDEFDRFNTHVGFTKAWNVVYRKRTKEALYDTEHPLHDCRFLNRKTLKRSVFLLKYFPKVFGDRPSREFFAAVYRKNVGYFGEGIHDLCRLKIADKKLERSFRKLCKRYSV